jgi:predicted O-methyltransferase YrrM
MNINLDDVKNCDLSFVSEFYLDKYERHRINEMNVGQEQGEHYKLLYYLTTLMENELILDLGTRDGLSALCLSHNKKNNVITYDLSNKPEELLQYEHKLPNLTFKQMNVFDESLDVFKKSKLIFLDLDPHDGIQEKRFMQLMESIDYEGIIVADDIVWFPNMANWWANIKQRKYDVTRFGHGSGTGLILFSENINVEGI